MHIRLAPNTWSTIDEHKWPLFGERGEDEVGYMLMSMPRHPKLTEFQVALGLDWPTAVGTIELLIHFTAEFAPRGDIGQFSDDNIAHAVGWPKEPQILLNALYRYGWLVPDDQGRPLFNEWPKFAYNHIHRRLAKDGICFADSSEPVKSGICKEDVESKWGKRTSKKRLTKTSLSNTNHAYVREEEEEEISLSKNPLIEIQGSFSPEETDIIDFLQKHLGPQETYVAITWASRAKKRKPVHYVVKVYSAERGNPENWPWRRSSLMSRIHGFAAETEAEKGEPTQDRNEVVGVLHGVSFNNETLSFDGLDENKRALLRKKFPKIEDLDGQILLMEGYLMTHPQPLKNVEAFIYAWLFKTLKKTAGFGVESNRKNGNGGRGNYDPIHQLPRAEKGKYANVGITIEVGKGETVGQKRIREAQEAQKAAETGTVSRRQQEGEAPQNGDQE